MSETLKGTSQGAPTESEQMIQSGRGNTNGDNDDGSADDTQAASKLADFTIESDGSGSGSPADDDEEEDRSGGQTKPTQPSSTDRSARQGAPHTRGARGYSKQTNKTQHTHQNPKRIFVGNIPRNCTTADLGRAISLVVGLPSDVKIIIDKDTQQSKGYGFITFDSEQLAQQCLDLKQSVTIRSRILNFGPAKRRVNKHPGGQINPGFMHARGPRGGPGFGGPRPNMTQFYTYPPGYQPQAFVPGQPFVPGGQPPPFFGMPYNPDLQQQAPPHGQHPQQVFWQPPFELQPGQQLQPGWEGGAGMMQMPPGQQMYYPDQLPQVGSGGPGGPALLPATPGGLGGGVPRLDVQGFQPFVRDAPAASADGAGPGVSGGGVGYGPMGAQGSQPGDAPSFNGPSVGTAPVAPQQHNPAAESQPLQNRQGNHASGIPRDGSGGQAMRQPWGATATSRGATATSPSRPMTHPMTQPTAWNVPRNNGPQIAQGASIPLPSSMAALNNSMAHAGLNDPRGVQTGARRVLDAAPRRDQPDAGGGPRL